MLLQFAAGLLVGTVQGLFMLQTDEVRPINVYEEAYLAGRQIGLSYLSLGVLIIVAGVILSRLLVNR